MKAMVCNDSYDHHFPSLHLELQVRKFGGRLGGGGGAGGGRVTTLT